MVQIYFKLLSEPLAIRESEQYEIQSSVSKPRAKVTVVPIATWREQFTQMSKIPLVSTRLVPALYSALLKQLSAEEEISIPLQNILFS